MDEATSGSAVFWVVQNDRDGEEQDVLGGFLAPPWLSFAALVEREKYWRYTHPYGKAEEFILWLCTTHSCTPITVQVYPFDD